tara:strand:+ start:477 stop:674 length:198 start_codon:yes stop_codon:yes gene_type:complete
MDILKDIIYHQNKELLTRMAEDLYIDDEQKINFIKKYHKKNFCIIKITNKDNTRRNIRNIIHCVK